MRIGPNDHAKVADAIRAAEATTDGEVIAAIAPASDDYADVALQWAFLVALLPMALAAAWPALLQRPASLIEGGWVAQPSWHIALSLLLVATFLAFLVGRLVFSRAALRMAVTPRAVREKRVRRRALVLFRAGTEQRTATRTGVLLYLSLAERRAEIVADAAIHAKVSPERWGDAMAALIARLREDRPGDGIAEAIAMIGAVLAEHFPHTGSDPNELPDRLILL